MNSEPVHLGVLLLAHQRPWLLPLIARQVAENWGERSVICVTLDRATSPVLRAVARMTEMHPRVRIFNSPIAALDRGENFMRLRNLQLEQLQDVRPNYACLWDDDHILECPREAKWRFGRYKSDLIYARKRFFWDGLDHVNTALPDHNSVLFFRYSPDDRFPEDRMIHAPAGVHDKPDAKVTQMRSTLLDIGYLTRNERERVFNAYKQAGKVDAATMALVSPPVLTPYRPRSHSACHSHEALRLAVRDLLCH